VRSLWSDLLTSYADKSILLVSHGGTIRALVTCALGLGPEHFHSFQQSNCGLTRLQFPPQSRQARLDLLNDTAHLGEGLPKLKEGPRGVRLLLISVSDVNPEAVRRLAAVFEDVVTDKTFVVGAVAQSVANQIFRCGPDSYRAVSEAAAETVVDQALQQNSGDKLRNVAVLGPEAILLRILRLQLRISDAAVGSLDLRPLEITCVHFPGHGIPAVLQTLNMRKPSPALVGA
jgi:phosphoserine phosphatase